MKLSSGSISWVADCDRADQRMNAYAIFEGGGAKGYAHVGALKAAEERGIRFRKVAGTSAGAIVAALVAAGYTADELLDPSKPLGSRGVLDIDPVDVLNQCDYRRILALAASMGRMRMPQGELQGRGVRAYFRRRRIAFARSPYATVFAQFLLLCGHGPTLRAAFRDFGITGTDQIVEWIDRLLRSKIPGDGRVTFGDLKMRLRVVAANLRTGLVHEFGGANDYDLPVAPAVVASACFPFFFRPVSMGVDMFVDGGLVSNLPAWIFDDERDDDPSFLPTFGFRLAGEPLVVIEQLAPTSMIEFIQRVLQTLQSGARRLEERRIDDYYGIDLTAQIPSLSFDEMRVRAPDLVSTGRACVEEFFRDEIGPQDPTYMSGVLRAVVNELRREYEWDDRVRAAVLLPAEDGKWARTVYSAYMDDDSDDRLRVRVDGLGVGACLRLREPIYVRKEKVALAEVGVNKYEIAARPGEISYSYAIPIFEDAGEWEKQDPTMRAVPFAALVIDKSKPIDDLLLDEDQQDALANLATIVGEEVWDKALVRQKGGERKLTSEPSGWKNLDANGGVSVSRRKARDVGDTNLGSRLGRTISSMGASLRKSSEVAIGTSTNG